MKVVTQSARRHGRALRSLRFAVRGSVLIHGLGQLMVPLGLLGLVPAAVAAGLDRLEHSASLLAVSAVLIAGGWLGQRLGRRSTLQRNEGLVLTALSFVVASVAGAIPLVGYGLSPLDAWFEAVSGVTTTGLSVMSSIGDAPRSLIFVRAWMQWVGGLGIVVLALALVPMPGASMQRMGFERREMADLAEGTRAHARRALTVYGLLTLAGLALLLGLGMGPLSASVYTLSAVSTGGFSLRDDSLASLPTHLQAAVLLLAVLGSITFSAYYAARFLRLRDLLREPRFWSVIGSCGVAALTLIALGAAAGIPGPTAPGPDLGAPGQTPIATTDRVLTAISAQTTAGFSTVDVARFDTASQLALIASMIVGGEMGSTAGGLKLFRLLVLARLVMLALDRASIPKSGRVSLRVGGAHIGPAELESMMALVVAYLGLIGVSWLAFLAYGYPPLAALFDVVSAVGTVGLSSGVTSAELPALLKGVLILDMLMGRLEIVAILVLLRPATWIGRRRKT